MTKRTIPWSMALPLGIVFLLDCANPWSWPFCLCYVLCILLTDRSGKEQSVSSLPILATILTLLGMAISAVWGMSSAAMLVRLLAIALCWMTADLINRLSHASEAQVELTRELAIKLSELDIEKELRVRESRYQVYLDHASDAVFLFNSQAVILDVNSQACESLGRTREELIGQTPPFFARIDSNEFLNNIISTLSRGQQVSFDGIHRHRVHGEFPVEVRIRPFTAEGERLALGIARNITERKRIEAELRFSEQKFRDLADAIPQIVWISDPELNIQYFNARAMEFSGATTTELLSNEQWLQFVHPDDLPAVEERAKRTLETGVTEDSEIRLRRHDGEYRWHICRQIASRNSEGEIERWYGTCTDIELQKRDESALRDSEQRFVGFMQHFPGFAWIKNLDGRYIFANNKFDQLVEGRHDSVRGLTDDEIFEPHEAAAFRQGDIRAIQNCSGIHEFQTVKVSNDDDAQFFVSKFPILGPQGKPFLVGGMAIDVTKEKQSESAIAAQNRIMERIATRSSLHEILELIVELMEDRIPGSQCSILIYDEHENRFRFGAGHSLNESYIKAVDGLEIGPEVGCCGASIHRREPVIAPDVLTSPLWKDYRDLATANGIRSCWSVPIFSRPHNDSGDEQRQVLGTFAIYKPIVWEPRHTDAQIVATATYLASVAIEREADIRSLKEGEKRYRALVDNAPIGIYVNVDNRFAYVNDATRRLMGADSKDQLLGTPTLDRFHPNVVTEIRERIDKMLNRGESVPWLTHRYIRMDGSEVDVETIGIPIQFGNRAAVQVLINDISERKRSEEKLNATVKRLEMLYRASPVGICLSTMEDGTVLEANEIYINMTGFQSDMIIGRRTIEFGQWPDPDRRNELTAALKQHGSVKNWEVGFRRIDGTIGYSLRSFERLELDGRECILTMVSDITAMKEIEEELRISRQRLEVLSRQLIATQEIERRHLARELHDEIGQILTAIKINLSRTQKTVDPPIQTSLEENVTLVEQAIDQVRNLSLSLRPPQLDQLGLIAALHWLVKHQARIGRFDVDLDADIGDQKVTDDVAIVCFRVTQEALTNAVRHAKTQHVRVRLRVVQNELQLTIEDDGIGFDALNARHRATRGASIGLLSMQERVSLVGGHLEIDSVVGQGTTIRSCFPIQSALVTDERI